MVYKYLRVWSLRASTGFPKIIRVVSTQKRRKTLKFRVLVLCQVPLETIMRVGLFTGFEDTTALEDKKSHFLPL